MNDEPNYNSHQESLDRDFIAALERKDFVEAEKLLGFGARIRAFNPERNRSAYDIIRAKSFSFKKSFVYTKKNREALSRLHRVTELIDAAKWGKKDKVEGFLKENEFGKAVLNQALIGACEQVREHEDYKEGKVQVAMMLMEEGANPNFHFMLNSKGRPHSALNVADPELKQILQIQSLTLAPKKKSNSYFFSSKKKAKTKTNSKKKESGKKKMRS